MILATWGRRVLHALAFLFLMLFVTSFALAGERDGYAPPTIDSMMAEMLGQDADDTALEEGEDLIAPSSVHRTAAERRELLEAEYRILMDWAWESVSARPHIEARMREIVSELLKLKKGS